MLDDDALRAVLAHEAHHAQRHDPLRLAAGRVLAGALFFLPALGDLVERQQALAELSADESAVRAAPDNRSALARAMLSFSDAPESAGSMGIDPARVDYLLGEPPSWRFPALLCVVAASVIVLLAAIALLAAQLASGAATLALPFIYASRASLSSRRSRPSSEASRCCYGAGSAAAEPFTDRRWLPRQAEDASKRVNDPGPGDKATPRRRRPGRPRRAGRSLRRRARTHP